jgi:hypothetical protein
MVAFADHIGKPIQLLYYPPYHHAVERLSPVVSAIYLPLTS